MKKAHKALLTLVAEFLLVYVLVVTASHYGII